MKKLVSVILAAMLLVMCAGTSLVFAADGEYNVGVLYNSELGTVEILTNLGTVGILANSESSISLAAATDWKADSSTPVAAGSTYINDDNLKVSSVYATTLKNVNYAIGGTKYTHYIQIRLDKDPASGSLTEKSGSTPIIIEAKKSGTLTYAYRRQKDSNSGNYDSGDGKDLKVSKKNADGTYTLQSGRLTLDSVEEGGAFGYCIQSIELDAGEEYLMWATGTTGSLCGMSFVEKQITKVNSGDIVTIKSTPNNNAWIGNVTISDSEIELVKNTGYTECSFVMPEKNVDVSVDFINKSVQNETDKITFDMIKGMNIAENNVVEDLDLIQGQAFTIGYADVSWESSNPDIISISGIVNTNNESHNVTITAVCTFQDYPNLRITKDFNLIVPADTDDAGAVAVAKEALDIGDTTAVKSNLELPTKGRRGTTVTWTSSNPEVISTDGVVNRKKGIDTQVTLTASITRGNEKETKIFEVNVLGYTAVEISRVAVSNSEGRVVVSPTDGGYVSHIIYTDSISEADRTGEETMVVAVYDKSDNGVLTACKMFNLKNTTENVGEETILYLNPEDIPVSSNSEIKVFAFDSISSVEPIMNESYTYGHTVADNATIYVAGDSTASVYKTSNPNNDFPRTGWAQVLGDFFADGVTVKDLALSGRSSLSFRGENNYKTIINGLKPGDYFIIQFGHNDAKAEADRYTNPDGDRFTDGTFKNSIYQYYVKPALDKGAYPLITTSICHCYEVENATHEKYVNAARELAQELGLPYIDLFDKTRGYIDANGIEKAKDIFAYIKKNDSRFVKGAPLPESFKKSIKKNTIGEIGDFANSQYLTGGEDKTHIQYYGAQMISQWACDELKELGHPLTSKRSTHVMTIDDLPSYAEATSVN